VQAILFGSIEMQMLWWSAVLGLAQLFLAAGLMNRDRGLLYNFSSRDQPVAPLSPPAARADRAFKNFLETFSFFAAAILMVTLLQRTTPTSELGAHLYFWARVAYVPIYVTGIPYLRSAVWTVAFVGLLLVLLTVWPGV
jgi:uncharacterized MAPEG superfamily protein